MGHFIRAAAVVVWAAGATVGVLGVPVLAFDSPPLAAVALVVLAMWAIGGIFVLGRDRRRNPWTGLAAQRRKLALKQASEAAGIRQKFLQYVEDERGGHVVDRRTGQPVRDQVRTKGR